MKFNKNNLQENDSNTTLEKKSRKKTEWKQNEDNYLRKYIKKFRGKNTRIKWRIVSAKIQEKFAEDAHQYTPKACKDRYNHYLKEGLNLNKSTEDELTKLMELTKIHGNQWSIIAQQMNNRTEQFVKNKFYALVRKTFRKLIQIVFKKRNSSKMTNTFKAHIISNFICSNKEDDLMPVQEKQIKEFAQELIFDNLKITKQSQINLLLHDKLIKVLEFMEKKNEEYIRLNKRVSNKNKSCKNLDEELNCFQVNQKPQNCFFYNCNGEKFEVPLTQISYKVQGSYLSQKEEQPNLLSNCSEFLNFYSNNQIQINSLQNYHLSQF